MGVEDDEVELCAVGYLDDPEVKCEFIGTALEDMSRALTSVGGGRRTRVLAACTGFGRPAPGGGAIEEEWRVGLEATTLLVAEG